MLSYEERCECIIKIYDVVKTIRSKDGDERYVIQELNSIIRVMIDEMTEKELSKFFRSHKEFLGY